MPDDCIFCKIVAGELPAEIVQEDEHTIAFMDINPWTRGHALVIPRNHSRNLYDAPDEDLEHTVTAAKRLALTDARHARLRRHQPAEFVRGRPLGRPSSTCTCT